MRNLFTTVSLLVSVYSFSQTTTIGSCTFKGKKPTKINVVGNMEIYHNGSVKNTQVSGGKNIWTGDGDVWVIFKSNEASRKNEFRIDGKVQECLKD